MHTLTRYGREDEEVMGLKFCNEAIIALKQIWPTSNEKEPLTPLQVSVFFLLIHKTSQFLLISIRYSIVLLIAIECVSVAQAVVHILSTCFQLFLYTTFVQIKEVKMNDFINFSNNVIITKSEFQLRKLCGNSAKKRSQESRNDFFAIWRFTTLTDKEMCANKMAHK